MQKQPRGTGITGTAGLLSCCAAFFAEDGGVEGVVEGKAVRLRFQVGLQLRHLCVQGGNIHAVELSKALLCGLELYLTSLPFSCMIQFSCSSVMLGILFFTSSRFMVEKLLSVCETSVW